MVAPIESTNSCPNSVTETEPQGIPEVVPEVSQLAAKAIMATDQLTIARLKDDRNMLLWHKQPRSQTRKLLLVMSKRG